MALSVNSQSQPFAYTQTYLVTGTVGDTITASIPAGAPLISIAPVSAKMVAGGVLFNATRIGTTGGAVPLTFTDSTSGETETVTVNMAGDPVVTPNPIVGHVGDLLTVSVSETNDPNAFATLSIADTTIAQITSSSNAEGQASLSISLLKNGTTSLSVDDGHGGTLTVQILVGAAPPTQNVNIAAGEAVVGGVVVAIPAALVALQDSSSGYNSAGRYTISLKKDGTLLVTYGKPPPESTTQINLASAVFTIDGKIFTADLRTQNVTVQAVNSMIMAEPNADGSYFADGVVTLRTLGNDVLAELGGPTSGTTEPTNPHQNQLFFNTTSNVLEIYENGSWVVITEIGGSSTLSGLTDVAIVAPADGDVLTYKTAASKWENVQPQIFMPLVNGDLPGPGVMANEWGQCIYVAI